MKSLIFVLIAGTLSCGSQQSPDPENQEVMSQEHHEGDEPNMGPATATGDVLPNDGTRAIGDVTTCPVTKEVFTISETSPSSIVDGKTYYFCCKGCVKDFAADPAKYLSVDEDEAQPEHADAEAAHTH